MSTTRKRGRSRYGTSSVTASLKVPTGWPVGPRAITRTCRCPQHEAPRHEGREAGAGKNDAAEGARIGGGAVRVGEHPARAGELEEVLAHAGTEPSASAHTGGDPA